MTTQDRARTSHRLLTALLLGGLLSTGPAAARADPVGDATVRATALRTRVAALVLQAEQATEAYDAAEATLGVAVAAHLNAQRDLAAAQAASGDSQNRAGARVRALYMAGGSAGLYASVLASTDLSEALTRLHDVGAVLDGDHRAARSAGTAVDVRQRSEGRLAASARDSTRLQAVVATHADAVRSLLAQADTLLAQADQQVRALVAQQERDAEAAAAARAAEELARLQAAALANPDRPTPPGELPIDAPAGTRAAAALAFARAQLGKPYLWGATGPDSFDCSGLTGAAYAAAGLHLPRTASEQWYAGPHVSLAALQPGDLLFWASDLSNPATIHHVALYLGSGQMLAAPHTGTFVRIEPLYLDGYLGAVRPGGG